MTLCLEWTDEREAQLKELHDEGLSASQIAFKLGGTTRNAVIGKRARMKLAPVNKPGKDNSPRAPRKNSRNKASSHIVSKIAFRVIEGGFGSTRVTSSIEKSQTIELKCAEVVPLNKGFLELETNDCRYPSGDEQITFCGHPRRDDKTSYCAAHHFLCWAAPRPPKSRAFPTSMARAAS